MPENRIYALAFTAIVVVWVIAVVGAKKLFGVGM